MKTNISSVKQICIKGYLAKLEIQPAKRTTGGFMYLSPLRKETDPSFKVDENKNCWYDHGMGKGGSIIDLVMGMERCTFSEAVERLKTGNMAMWTPPKSPCPQYLGIEITDVRSLEHPALLKYLESRGVEEAIAKPTCKEVHYQVRGKNYFAIGFENDSGGWELRNVHFKGCLSKDISTRVGVPKYDKVIVFEGFIDYLSYFALCGKIPEADFIVLNSIANIKKAIPSLSGYSRVMLMLDNDDAGRQGTAQITQLLPDSNVVDYSSYYASYKDVNDSLLSKLKR